MSLTVPTGNTISVRGLKSVAISTLDPRFRAANATSDSGDIARVTITGVDTQGQMFRRPAVVLQLEGRDCLLRSDRQPETGGSVLIEVHSRHGDPGDKVLHASVKSSTADADTGLYTAVVELEFAQAGKILSAAIAAQTQTGEPLRPATSTAIKPAPANAEPIKASGDIPSRPSSKVISQHAVPASDEDDWVNVTRQIPESLESSHTGNPVALEEAVKSAVASQVTQELERLRTSISIELKEALPAIVSPNLEKIVREAVEKQIASTKDSSIQGSDAGIARQVSDHISELRVVLADDVKKLVTEQLDLSKATADSLAQELSSHAAAIMRSMENSTSEIAQKLADEQTALSRIAAHTAEQQLTSRAAEIMSALQESTSEMAKRLLAEQAEISRTAGDRVEQELSSRVAQIMRSFEEFTAESARKLLEQQTSISRAAADDAARDQNSRAMAILQSFEESTAALETRINHSRAAAEAVLSRSESLQQEINDQMVPLQRALHQLNDISGEGTQTFKSQIISEMNRRGAQFEDQINDIARERAIGFAEELESRMAPNQRQADELLEKLSAVFQLLQTTARVQQERLTEHSRATASSFEKEIRSVLLRFAGGSPH